MKKIDLKKELKYLYAPSAKKVEIVDVPAFTFVMVDGLLPPAEKPETSQEFQQAMTALYGISYTLKFMSKQRQDTPLDYTVMALEGLWWIDEHGFEFDHTKAWNWTVMILQPEHITDAMYQEALQQLKKRILHCRNSVLSVSRKDSACKLCILARMIKNLEQLIACERLPKNTSIVFEENTTKFILVILDAVSLNGCEQSCVILSRNMMNAE